MTKPPGRVTAPRAYTMPACGTVTMSPGCSTMLLEVSPVSKMRLRLTVMMFARGGGTGPGASGAFDGAWEELFAEADAVAGPGGAEFEGASGAGAGAASARPIAGGSE